ncbi:YqaA family protein [Confluentibacter sediminis]|uniref:YqaA family protein n=1 Tax=Confluentibacter sediminis TaxID=2219045 RepID=UPI000DAD5871|nr:short-chain dehydrogenase [Confluentibacter sediminis]
MKSKTKTNTGKSRSKLLHQYYQYTGFYSFVWKSVLKALPYIIVLVAGVFVFNHYYNINTLLVRMTDTLPAWGVLSVFFISETILGLVPPEIFIAWSAKMDMPWVFLGILGSLSYVGGLLSYWIGIAITNIPVVHNYLEVKMAKQLKNSKKWGGFLIVVGALLPLPFSISCMAAGLIKFPFKNVMLFGSLRLVRFLIYGLILFHVF